MLNLALKLKENLPADICTYPEIATIVRGSDDSRYGLIKRAIAKGELVQLRRGVYALGQPYQRQALNLFEAAQKVYAPSYVSLESALSFHGWIPEGVQAITSVSAHRSVEFQTPVGLFTYARIPQFNFIGVERRTEGRSIFLIALPAKALIDYVYVHKIEVASVREFLEGIRIEEQKLRQISGDLLTELAAVHRSRRIIRFVRQLQREFWL